MKTQLQIAQELEKAYNHAIRNGFVEVICKKQAKANLEDLGCGKRINEIGIDWICGIMGEFCPDCLAKGVDKAKEIYERILNLNSEESEK